MATREEIRKAYSGDMSIIEKIEGVIRSPAKFFSAVRDEKGVKNAFVYLAIISAVSSVLNYYFNPFSSMMFAMFGQLGVALIAVGWIFTILFSFVTYGFFHLFVLLLGGKQGYHNTYKAFAYGSTPAALLGWIPFIFLKSFDLTGLAVMLVLFIVLYVWSFYITIKGISILQKMSMLRALGVILLPIIIILAIIMLLVGLFIFTVLSLAAGGGNIGLPSGYDYSSLPNYTSTFPQPPEENFILSVGTAPPDIVYIRVMNTGTTGFDTSEIFMFIDENIVSCSWDKLGKILPGEAAQCKTFYLCSSGSIVRASTPNFQLSTACLGP